MRTDIQTSDERNNDDNHFTALLRTALVIWYQKLLNILTNCQQWHFMDRRKLYLRLVEHVYICHYRY